MSHSNQNNSGNNLANTLAAHGVLTVSDIWQADGVAERAIWPSDQPTIQHLMTAPLSAPPLPVGAGPHGGAGGPPGGAAAAVAAATDWRPPPTTATLRRSTAGAIAQLERTMDPGASDILKRKISRDNVFNISPSSKKRRKKEGGRRRKRSKRCRKKRKTRRRKRRRKKRKTKRKYRTRRK